MFYDPMIFQDPLTRYIFGYYAELLSPTEQAARANIFYLNSNGGNELLAQLKKNEKISDDPAVLELLSCGIEEFGKRTAARIMSEHKDKVFLNWCPKCNKITRTPKAQQCFWCGYDWHPPAPQ